MTDHSTDIQPSTQRPGASVLRLPDVVARTGRARSTLYADIQQGAFPRPIRLGPRSVGWYASEIDDWLASRSRA